MKHNRMTAGSFAALVSPLAGLAVALAGVLPARGGDVPFSEHVISTTATAAFSVFATDVDGDGDTDILATSGPFSGDGKIMWYENDGGSPPTFTEHVISTNVPRTHSVFATDVDGDGDIDVLSASFADNKIAWYENDGGSPPSFTERVISSLADQARTVFATDVDGDGDIDVLSASFGDDKIAWYENDGLSLPSFTERVISTAADGATYVFATDVDGDGDTDVLSASQSDDKIAWYENDGGSPPTFTERVISTAANGAQSVFATDVDGDGDTDVLSASIIDDTIAWYESDGGSPPTFTERVISSAADGAASVFATDVDGDGDTDVLFAALNDDTIAWYENDGSLPPTFTERVISTVADGAFSVFATDVDGDGDTDVLSASGRDAKIAWYENSPPDTDADGVLDGQDVCPKTPSGEAVDLNGCSDSQVDSDGDGFCDPGAPSSGPSVCIGTDNCPDSDLSATIIIDGNDTGVENELLADGCTLADLIDTLVTDDPTSVDVVQFMVALKAEGIITGQNLGVILQALNTP